MLLTSPVPGAFGGHQGLVMAVLGDQAMTQGDTETGAATTRAVGTILAIEAIQIVARTLDLVPAVVTIVALTRQAGTGVPPVNIVTVSIANIDIVDEILAANRPLRSVQLGTMIASCIAVTAVGNRMT